MVDPIQKINPIPGTTGARPAGLTNATPSAFLPSKAANLPGMAANNRTLGGGAAISGFGLPTLAPQVNVSRAGDSDRDLSARLHGEMMAKMREAGAPEATIRAAEDAKARELKAWKEVDSLGEKIAGLDPVLDGDQIQALQQALGQANENLDSARDDLREAVTELRQFQAENPGTRQAELGGKERAFADAMAKARKDGAPSEIVRNLEDASAALRALQTKRDALDEKIQTLSELPSRSLAQDMELVMAQQQRSMLNPELGFASRQFDLASRAFRSWRQSNP
jgi:hypothetical protein